MCDFVDLQLGVSSGRRERERKKKDIDIYIYIERDREGGEGVGGPRRRITPSPRNEF